MKFGGVLVTTSLSEVAYSVFRLASECWKDDRRTIALARCYFEDLDSLLTREICECRPFTCSIPPVVVPW